MTLITEKFKAALWQAYGAVNSPAEWDGNILAEAS